MARHVLLNNVDHKNLRVITRRGAQSGDNYGNVVVFPTEYRELQREYPIFFRKDPGGDGYLSVAMLGFAKDENLFLEDGGWNARYLPSVVARGPFLIGFQEAQVDGELRKSPVIHIDLDHPQVSETKVSRCFSSSGQRALCRRWPPRSIGFIAASRSARNVRRLHGAGSDRSDQASKSNCRDESGTTCSATTDQYRCCAPSTRCRSPTASAGFSECAYLVIGSVRTCRSGRPQERPASQLPGS